MRPPWAGPSLLDKTLSYLGLTETPPRSPRSQTDPTTPGWSANPTSIAAELDGIAKEVARLAQRVAQLERDLQRRGR